MMRTSLGTPSNPYKVLPTPPPKKNPIPPKESDLESLSPDSAESRAPAVSSPLMTRVSQLPRTSSDNGLRQRSGRIADKPNQAPPSQPPIVSEFPEEKSYELRDLTPEEKREIDERLALHPEFTQKYEILTIQRVRDLDAEALFDLVKKNLFKATSKVLNPPLEEGLQQMDLRKLVEKSIEKLTIKERNVQILRAFHGTKEKFRDEILKSGIHFTGGTDPGYIGQGPYASTDPLYAAKYGDVLFIVDLVFRRLYPVAPCDNFMGASIKPGFDGHAMRAGGKSDRINEMVYNPCQPWDEKKEESGEKKVYPEVCVRDHTQVLIRYAMKIELKESFRAQNQWTKADLGNWILDYMSKYPKNDQFIALNKKVDEINISSEKELDTKERDLCNLLKLILGEKGDVNSQITDQITSFLPKHEEANPLRDNISALINQAKNHITENHFADAAKLLWRALEKEPKDLEALCLLATVYLRKDCVKQAYCLAIRALVVDPTYAPALRARGIYYYYACFDSSLGDSSYEKARNDFSDQTHTIALLYRARLYLAMNSLQEAQKDCNLLLEKDPNHFSSLLLRAKIALMLKQPDQAEKDLKKCKELKPDEFAILALKAELYVQKNKVKESVRLKALRGLDKSIETYRKWVLKEKEEKRKHLKRQDHIDFYYILLQRAELHLKGDSFQLALDDCQEAKELFSHRPEAYKLRSSIYRLWKMSEKSKKEDVKVLEEKAREDDAEVKKLENILNSTKSH